MCIGCCRGTESSSGSVDLLTCGEALEHELTATGDQIEPFVGDRDPHRLRGLLEHRAGESAWNAELGHPGNERW
jgi:hypothetical protein